MSNNTVFQISKTSNGAQALVYLPTRFLMQMVQAAVNQIQTFLNPESSEYIPPSSKPLKAICENPSLLKLVEVGLKTDVDKIEGVVYTWFNGLWSQVEFLEMYARTRNANAKESSSMVGEHQGVTKAVYYAIIAAHKWKAECNEELTKDKEGDQVTRSWSRSDTIELIRDWPKQYKFTEVDR